MESDPALDVDAALTEAGAELRPSDRRGVWRFVVSDRRGWLWLEETTGGIIVHLSLLVADGAGAVQEVHELIEHLPPPAFCEFHHGEREEFVRVVARFRADERPDALTSYLRRLAGIADLVTEHVQAGELHAGDDALHDLWVTFGDAGIAAPPIPTSCRGALTILGPWWWGSVLMHPFSMYMFDAPDDLMGTWNRQPLFALSHAGHGVNSYGLNLAVAAGPVAAFVQHGYGGAYSDPVRDLERIAATYARLHQVITAAEQHPSSPARWLLLMSKFRAVYQLIDLETLAVPTSDGATRPYETIEFTDEQAMWRGLVDRLPYEFALGVPVDW